MRAAVGRIANVGDLYNARTDSFLGVSIFKKSPPPAAIRITDSPFSDIQYVRSVTFSEKFEKLDIKADLKVSILAGLLKLEGHGKYLSDEKKSARAVRSSLLYNIKTKVERLEIYNEELKDCFSLDAISNKDATHVVIEVNWGANSMVTLEYANSENREIKEIEGSLDAQLKKIAYSVSGKLDVDYKTNEENKEDNFSYHIFADMLPNECLPQTFEEVLTIMKSMPSFVQKANDGKGKPLQYTLIPLSVLEEYLKVSQMSDRLIKQIDEQSIVCFVQLFDDISKVKQELNDIYNDMQSHLYCTPTEDIKKLGETKNKFSRIEAVLRSKLAKALVDIRSEDASTQQLESIRKEFENGEYSIEKVRDIINSYQNIIEKITFADFLKKEGVTYIGLSSSIDEEKWKNLKGDIYVLFFSQKLKQNWNENLHLFLSLLESSNDDSNNRQVNNPTTFIAVDLDVCPEIASKEAVGKGIRICHYKNGEYINFDVYAEHLKKESICCAKSTSQKELCHKPKKRVNLQLRCPGTLSGDCEIDDHTWYCPKCNEILEYGFDGFFYCSCGCAPSTNFRFKCSSKKHGMGFISFPEKELKKLIELFTHIKQLKPHAIIDTITLNEARKDILCLNKPIADISQNIQNNISIVENKRKEVLYSEKSEAELAKSLYIDTFKLEPVDLGHPRTVCTNKKCVNYHDNVIEYVTHCHVHCYLSGVTDDIIENPKLQKCDAMNEKLICTKCGCRWNQHMHLTYEQKRVPDRVIDNFIQTQVSDKQTAREQIEEFIHSLEKLHQELKDEQKKITEVSVKFGRFLRDHSIAPYNDALEKYLSYLIEKEEDSAAISKDRQTLDRMIELRNVYDKEVEVLKTAMSEPNAVELTISDIKESVNELFSLKHNGEQLKKAIEKASSAKSKMMEYESYHKISAPPMNHSNNDPKPGKFKKVLNYFTTGY